MSANLSAVGWLLVTIAIYVVSRQAYRRWPRWWLSPLLVTWTSCGVLIIALHTRYEDYLIGTGWMIDLLVPATVAFAIPIYEYRTIIARNGWVLAVGIVTGSLIAVGVSWGLATWLGFPPELCASLLPRSITTPLAMSLSQRIGGTPGLTASFTAITGLFGAAIGDVVLKALPFRSSFARGALFGMGAHGAGVAKARELGKEEGAVAGLVMVCAGLLNVLAGTAIVAFIGPS